MNNANGHKAQVESHVGYPEITADFKQIVCSAPFGVMLLHQSGFIEFGNPTIYRELRLPPEVSNINSCWNSSLLPQDGSGHLPQLEEIHSSLTHSRGHYTLEVKVIHADQNPVYCWLTFQRLDDGKSMVVYSQRRTDRKSVLQQAVETEKTAPDTLDSLPLGYMEFNPDYQIVYMNRAGCKITGLSKADIEKGASVRQLFCAKCNSEEDFDSLIHADNRPHKKLRLQTKEGTILNVLAAVDKDGTGTEPDGIKCYFFDITWLTQTDKIIQSRLTPLDRESVIKSTIGFIEMHSDAALLYIGDLENGSIYTFTSYETDKPSLSTHSPDDLSPTLNSILKRVLLNGTPNNSHRIRPEYDFAEPASELNRLLMGRNIHSMICHPLHYEEKVLGAVFAGLQHRNRIPAALDTLLTIITPSITLSLKSSRNYKQEVPDTHLYSSLTENAHEGVLIVDDWHTSILYANSEACNIIGMNHEEIEHMKPIWLLALLKAGKPAVKNIIRTFNKKAENNQYLSAEILIHNLKHEVMPCEIRVNSVPAVRHRIYRISIFNLSDKKKNMLNVEQLANIKNIASSMVHDIHQPLSAINIAAETLSTRLKKFDVKANSLKNRSLLDSISKDTERIKHSISHFKKLSQSSEEEKNRIFDAVVELNSILEFYKNLCEQHAITLAVKIKEAAAFIRGNPYLFEQVIINLLNNARHSVQDKGYKKIITVHAYSMQSDFLLSIEDNGVGIAEENLPKIFEPFFSTKPSDEGTGLGLPIVRDIIHRMGGAIRVESVLNSYTAFLVQIPKNTGLIDG